MKEVVIKNAQRWGDEWYATSTQERVDSESAWLPTGLQAVLIADLNWAHDKDSDDWKRAHFITFIKESLRISQAKPLSSVQFSHSVVSDSLWPHELQHTRPPCPSQTPGIYPNSCASSRWCHWAISSSVVPFSSCPQSLPASPSFPMSQLIAWGGQSIGVSASASVLPMNTQDLSPSGWTGWISLQSKGPSRVFSNTTVQKHQFFGAQLFL